MDNDDVYLDNVAKILSDGDDLKDLLKQGLSGSEMDMIETAVALRIKIAELECQIEKNAMDNFEIDKKVCLFSSAWEYAFLFKYKIGTRQFGLQISTYDEKKGEWHIEMFLFHDVFEALNKFSSRFQFGG